MCKNYFSVEVTHDKLLKIKKKKKKRTKKRKQKLRATSEQLGK